MSLSRPVGGPNGACRYIGSCLPKELKAHSYVGLFRSTLLQLRRKNNSDF